MIEWKRGEPPKDGKTYLVMFKSGIIASANFTTGGYFGEPSPQVKAWRCECCGKFADPVAWAPLGDHRGLKND